MQATPGRGARGVHHSIASERAVVSSLWPSRSAPAWRAITGPCVLGVEVVPYGSVSGIRMLPTRFTNQYTSKETVETTALVYGCTASSVFVVFDRPCAGLFAARTSGRATDAILDPWGAAAILVIPLAATRYAPGVSAEQTPPPVRKTVDLAWPSGVGSTSRPKGRT
jgi:hypothetical protein